MTRNNRLLLFGALVAWIAAAIQFAAAPNWSDVDFRLRCMLAFGCDRQFFDLPVTLPLAFYAGLALLLIVVYRTFVGPKDGKR